MFLCFHVIGTWRASHHIVHHGVKPAANGRRNQCTEVGLAGFARPCVDPYYHLLEVVLDTTVLMSFFRCSQIWVVLDHLLVHKTNRRATHAWSSVYIIRNDAATTFLF